MNTTRENKQLQYFHDHHRQCSYHNKQMNKLPTTIDRKDGMYIIFFFFFAQRIRKRFCLELDKIALNQFTVLTELFMTSKVYLH